MFYFHFTMLLAGVQVDLDGAVMGGSSDEDSDDDDDAMDEELPAAPVVPKGPIIDEDGFQMVQTRSGRNR